MRVVEGVGNLGKYPACFICGKLAEPGEPPGEAFALHEGHDEPRDVAGDGRGVHGDDSRMIERGGGARLADEPLAECLMEGPLGWKDLDRNSPVLLAVRCFIHHGHAAAAELLVDLVLGCEELLDVGCQGVRHDRAVRWVAAFGGHPWGYAASVRRRR